MAIIDINDPDVTRRISEFWKKEIEEGRFPVTKRPEKKISIFPVPSGTVSYVLKPNLPHYQRSEVVAANKRSDKVAVAYLAYQWLQKARTDKERGQREFEYNAAILALDADELAEVRRLESELLAA